MDNIDRIQEALESVGESADWFNNLEILEIDSDRFHPLIKGFVMAMQSAMPEITNETFFAYGILVGFIAGSNVVPDSINNLQ